MISHLALLLDGRAKFVTRTHGANQFCSFEQGLTSGQIWSGTAPGKPGDTGSHTGTGVWD